MKLLVNISMLGPKPTGLGVYAAHCVQAACAAFDTELVAPEGYAGDGQVVLRAPSGLALGASKTAALRRWMWARRQRRFENRLVYSPTHHGFPKGDAQVLTVHDLISLRFPKQHPTQYLFFRYQLPRELARCRAVFTVSETTRRDIHETYGYPLDAIHVVPNGVSRDVFRPATSEPCSRTSTQHEPFLLIVGAGSPHKNVEELFAVGHLWKQRYRLLVVSSRGKYQEHLKHQARRMGLAHAVTILPYVELKQLVRLYQTCAAFVYPSKWEGFGIPPLEALACGAPVLASDIPAHREVLGAHASLVQLGSESSWKDAFSSIGQQRHHGSCEPSPLERYSWKNSATALRDSLRKLEPRLQ